MISYAVIILLVILVLSNAGTYIYNKLSPPCDPLTEYFNQARRLPDGATTNLGSIPSGSDINYIGAQTVETSIPNVIGLKSKNKNVTTAPKPADTKNLKKAIDKMFESDEQETSTTKQDITDFDGEKMANFEIEMEGIKASNSHRNNNKTSLKPSGHMKATQKDGYGDRDPDAW